MKIPKIFHFVIKYVAPAYLIIVFVGFCIQSLPSVVAQIGQDSVVQYTLAIIAAVVVGLIVVTRIGEQRWIRAKMDLNGGFPPSDENLANVSSGGKRQ